MLYFYFTIFSQIFFLLLSRFCDFKTLRDRAGFGGHLKNKVDYLYLVQNDVHWTLLLFTHQALFIYVAFKNTYMNNQDSLAIGIETIVSARFVANMYFNYMMYFGKENYFSNGVFN